MPENIREVIEKRLNYNKIYEIRLRGGSFASVNYGSKLFFLSEGGITTLAQNAIRVDNETVKQVVVKSTDHSLYAVNDALKTGYLTIAGGIRLGIAGEVVIDNGVIRTIKNFSSVNIRIPHEVVGAANKIMPLCFSSALMHSTLILSPPGAGKTTMLRDLARQLGQTKNVLVVDERCEIAAQYQGQAQLFVGTNTDVLSSCTKDFGITAGIRALAPDIIITDEIAGEEDARSVIRATTCGVVVIASVHARDLNDLKIKAGFSLLEKEKIFSRFVVLSSRSGVGFIEGIFNSEGKKLESNN